MEAQSAPLASQLGRVDLTQGRASFGFTAGSGKQLPRAGALQGAPGLSFLPRRPKQTTLGLSEVAFEAVVGAGQPRHVVTVEQAGPIAPADPIEVIPI